MITEIDPTDNFHETVYVYMCGIVGIRFYDSKPDFITRVS